MKTETLRYRLLEAQLDLARREERGVILLLTGHAATHKGAVVNRLNHWLENRHTEVHALGPSSEEQSRPYWWRYWQRLPFRDPGEQLTRVGRALLAAMEDPPEPPAATLPDEAPGIPSLRRAGTAVEARLDKAAYRERLARGQARLAANAREVARRRIPVVIAFEGHDAAGKGGSIHRVTAALDARQYRVHRIGAPSDEELALPWAWRFWRRLPEDGRIALFDRSWYGRVLVERVEGLASEAQWRRAYGEIRHFEQQLLAHGGVLIKVFLAIDKDEQLRRFEARAATPHKRHKLTDEDWRNRERWDDYQRAIDEMFARTHLPGAEWALIACDDKRRARLAVLEAVNERLEARLASAN